MKKVLLIDFEKKLLKSFARNDNVEITLLTNVRDRVQDLDELRKKISS